MPFLGDYIDLAPARTFKPPMTAGAEWTYNDDPDDTGVLHAAWTDNRDIVKPPTDASWSSDWKPAELAGCVPELVSIKNQNVYTSRLSRGLVVGVEGNSRVVAGGATDHAAQGIRRLRPERDRCRSAVQADRRP